MNEFLRSKNGNENDDEKSRAENSGSRAQAGGQNRCVVANCGGR
jgi:hypothetical protein